MGLGLHGGGRSLAQWLFSQGAEVIVTDLKIELSLRYPSLPLTRGVARGALHILIGVSPVSNTIWEDIERSTSSSLITNQNFSEPMAVLLIAELLKEVKVD